MKEKQKIGTNRINTGATDADSYEFIAIIKQNTDSDRPNNISNDTDDTSDN